jgi:hypothetical protein
VGEARAVPRTADPFERWPAAWATDTVLAPHDAFKGLSFTGAGTHRRLVQFDDRETYVGEQDQLKEKQFAKAGARLAELLKRSGNRRDTAGPTAERPIASTRPRRRSGRRWAAPLDGAPPGGTWKMSVPPAGTSGRSRKRANAWQSLQ